MSHYARPYVPGSITPDGWVVICVPGMRPMEVTTPLGTKLTEMILEKKYDAAKVLLSWFTDEVHDEHE